MLQVNLPSSQTYPLVRVTVKTPNGETTTMLDDSHSTWEVAIPKGTRKEQVEVTAQLCDARGEPDERMEPIVLKAASEVPTKTNPIEKKADTKRKPREIESE